VVTPADRLEAEVRTGLDDDPWDTEVMFSINGVRLHDILAGEGVDSEWLGPPLRVVAPPSDHLRGGLDRWEDPAISWFEGPRVAIAACLCGQPGCDAILMVVRLMPGWVRWTSFEWYRRPEIDLTNLEFNFDTDAYSAVLDGLIAR